MTSEENPSFVAWNYYPSLKEEERGKDLPPRLHAHADMDVMTILFQQDGHTGLEIAPGKDIDNKDLIEDIGNIWNGVPVAREWFSLVRETWLTTLLCCSGVDGISDTTSGPQAGLPDGQHWRRPRPLDRRRIPLDLPPRARPHR